MKSKGEGMSKVQKNLTSRRTVYKFKEQKVPAEIITEALEAASNAPCHKHTHPWRFYSIGNSTRKSLIPSITRLARKKSEKKKSNNVDADIQRAVSKIISAPILFAITSKKSPDDDFREKEDYAASVCALHNMVLSFWDNGIGSLWSTGSITRDHETYRILGINPNEQEIIGFVRAGYPLSVPSVKKPSFQEVTSYLD